MYNHGHNNHYANDNNHRRDQRYNGQEIEVWCAIPPRELHEGSRVGQRVNIRHVHPREIPITRYNDKLKGGEKNNNVMRDDEIGYVWPATPNLFPRTVFPATRARSSVMSARRSL
eukprot:PhF_6_TR27394/c0_g1_i1/m.40326